MASDCLMSMEFLFYGEENVLELAVAVCITL